MVGCGHHVETESYETGAISPVHLPKFHISEHKKFLLDFYT